MRSGKLAYVTVTALDREIYTEAEAARLLGRSPSTLNYWLHGATRNRITYPPILRPEVIDRRSVTWAEFIEAGWLSTYRRRAKVPMKELRAFIEDLRQRTQVPYPLAHAQPLVSGKSLVMEAQEAAGLEAEFCLVVPFQNQLMLSYSGEMFLDRVVWEGDLAVGWKVHSVKSPVMVRPDVRFGRPATSRSRHRKHLREQRRRRLGLGDCRGLQPSGRRRPLGLELRGKERQHRGERLTATGEDRIMKMAQVRFYLDADILGLASILGPLRNDITFPGDPWRSHPQAPTTAVPD